MRLRNFVIIFAISYVLMVFVSGVIEFITASGNAAEIQDLVEMAAQLSLEQIQTTDEFLSTTGYNTEGRFDVKILQDSNYVTMPIYDALLGVTDRDTIMGTLYNTPQFKEWANTTGNIRYSVPHWTRTSGGGSLVTWYSVPSVIRAGLTYVGAGTNISSAKMIGGAGSSTPVGTLAGIYGWSSPRRSTNYEGATVYYYNTPLKLGLTYLHPEVLSKLFMNNLDLLMRSKYAKEGIPLNSPAGGNGLLKGSFLPDTLDEGAVASFNPINNGSFTLLRGARSARGRGEVYMGVAPDIEYKVVDIFDAANADLLVHLFGAPNTASVLRSAAQGVDPATGAVPTTKLIVVAKVTFYADIVIPYTTMFGVEYRSDFGNTTAGTGNLHDIDRNGVAGGKTGFSGQQCFEYTTYFAVMP